MCLEPRSRSQQFLQPHSLLLLLPRPKESPKGVASDLEGLLRGKCMIRERKVCVHCHEEKLSSEFYVKKSKNKNGTYRQCLHSLCKKCYLAACRKWDDRNQDKRRAYARRYHRRKKFGVESIDYVRMLESQSHVCAICGKEPKRRLDIDHSHSSSHVRGLLCSNCNNGLGRFMDNASLLRKAAAYLEQHEVKAA